MGPCSDGEPLAQVRYATWYTGVGRLKPGVTLEQARGEIWPPFKCSSDSNIQDRQRHLGRRRATLKEIRWAVISSSLWLLFGAVSVLLLIACTKSLVLLSRAREPATGDRDPRVARATRKAVTAQRLPKTAVLVIAAARWDCWLPREPPPPFVRRRGFPMDEAGVDMRILLYTLASAAIVTLLCVVLPAIGLHAMTCPA